MKGVFISTFPEPLAVKNGQQVRITYTADENGIRNVEASVENVMHNIPLKSIMSNIAYWAVYLHPTGQPENLSKALDTISTAYYLTWPTANAEPLKVTEPTLRLWISKYLMGQPEVKAWGEPSNDFLRQGTYIGLDFFEHAVVQSIILDAEGY